MTVQYLDSTAESGVYATTGDVITLDNSSPVAGNQLFSDSATNGSDYLIKIVDADGNWKQGVCTYASAGGTLTLSGSWLLTGGTVADSDAVQVFALGLSADGVTTLAPLAGLTSAANKVPYFTGSGTADLIDFKDEDDMASDSSSAVPSQQSVKAYADRNVITADTTITVAASGADYTTVGAAYASLNDKRIANGVTVTISVAAGTYSENTIYLSHPQGSQIHIVGASSTMTVLEFAGGDGHGFYCSVQGGNIANLRIRAGVAGAGAAVLSSNSAVVFLGTDIVIEAFYYALLAQYAGHIFAEQSPQFIDCTGQVIRAEGASSVRTSGLTVSGSVTAVYGFVAEHNSYITLFSVTWAQNSTHSNLCTDGATVIVTGTFSGDCAGDLFYVTGGGYLGFNGTVSGAAATTFNIDSGSSLISSLGITFTGSASFAFAYVLHGSHASLQNTTISGACGYGLFVSANASVNTPYITISGATEAAVYLQELGYASIWGAAISGSPGAGVYASRNSFVLAGLSTVTGATTDYSPAVNTEGNTLSYIAK